MADSDFTEMNKTHEDRGYKVAAECMQSGKSTLKNLENFFAKYAKAETNMAKSFETMAADLLGDASKLNQAATETMAIKEVAERFKELGVKRKATVVAVKRDFEKILKDAYSQHDREHREQIALYQKDEKFSASCQDLYDKMRKAYLKCCNELSTLRESSNARTPKEAEKMALRLKQAEDMAKNAEEKYHNAEKALREAQEKCQNCWVDRLKKINELEERRVNTVKSTLSSFASMLESNSEKDIEVFLKFKELALLVDAGKDISSLVRSTAKVAVPANRVLEAFNTTKTLQVEKVGEIVGEARTLYSYEALSPEELSFQPDQTLYILAKDDSGWWRAEMRIETSRGQETMRGFIPSNFVEMIKYY